MHPYESPPSQTPGSHDYNSPQATMTMSNEGNPIAAEVDRPTSADSPGKKPSNVLTALAANGTTTYYT
mgnify:CR=1 FL=1